MGLIYQLDQLDGNRAAYLIPTRLITMLGNTSLHGFVHGTLRTSDQKHNDVNAGFIIVATNFRVYAYTSSPLQCALLSLFTNIRSKHPNLVAGNNPRPSIQRAVRQGISADQIIKYLHTYAHPQMRAARTRPVQESRGVQSTLVLATVLDQIHLRRLERERMSTVPRFLLQGFAKIAQYQSCCKRAEEMGILMWKDDGKNMLFVNLSCSEKLRTFMEP